MYYGNHPHPPPLDNPLDFVNVQYSRRPCVLCYIAYIAYIFSISFCDFKLKVVEMRSLGWQTNPLINAYYKQRLVLKFVLIFLEFAIMTGLET